MGNEETETENNPIYKTLSLNLASMFRDFSIHPIQLFCDKLTFIIPLSLISMKKHLLLLLCFGAVGVHAQSVEKQPLQVTNTQENIVADGNLDESAWQNALSIQEFYEISPGIENKPSAVPVTAKLLYSKTHLYFSIQVTEAPSALQANLGNRDTQFSDDFGMLMLDTYNTQSFAYLIGATPKNVQLDGRKTNSGNDDVGFNVLYESGAKITETGYQLEFAIPFSSLRFPDAAKQTWRFSFFVNRPRDVRYQVASIPLDHNNSCFLCQWSTLEGIEGIQAPRLPIEIVPALVGANNAIREGGGLSAENLNFKALDPSLTLKYPLSSSSTAELTLNPDFSQIEADAAQIDINNPFALFFEEHRPFFQEGAELFNTWIDQVYTRSINNPAVAGKFVGRYGNTSIGYIGALDENSPIVVPFEEFSRTYKGGKSISNILRVRQSIGKQGSYVGGILTDRRFTEENGGSGSSVGVDALYRINPTYQIELNFVGSATQEAQNLTLSNNLQGVVFDGHTGVFDGESFTGWGSYISLERNSSNWWADLDYAVSSPTLRLDNGSLFQNGRKKNSMSIGYNFYYKDKALKQYSPKAFIGAERDFNNTIKDVYLYSGHNFSLTNQTSVSLGILAFSNEKYRDVQFNGMQRIEVGAESQLNKRLVIGLGGAYGESIYRSGLKMGVTKSFDLAFSYKPIPTLSFEPEFRFQDLYDKETDEKFFSGYILRNRFNWQITQPLSLRLINEYNSFGKSMQFQPLIGYQLNPLSIFYLGANWNYSQSDAANKEYLLQNELAESFTAESRSIFFKFQYLFRV